VIKELQITLYEIFGYLLPGAVCTAALSVAFLAIYFPKTRLHLTLRQLRRG
jgi:hypothetical protein